MTKAVRVALGRRVTKFTVLDTFELPKGHRMEVVLRGSEFTCRCPVTGQPDFATVEVVYWPSLRCVETKSLKLYLETFRDRAQFHELLAVEIRDALVKVLAPESLRVTMKFNTRGGIAVDAASSYEQEVRP